MSRKYEVGSTYRFIQIVNAKWPIAGPSHNPMAQVKDLPWMFALKSITVIELRCVSHTLLPRQISGELTVECAVYKFTDYKQDEWMLASPDPVDVLPADQAAVQVHPLDKNAIYIDPFVDYESFDTFLSGIIANQDNWHSASAVKATREFASFLNMTVGPMSLPDGFHKTTTNLGDVPVRKVEGVNV
jgi:hypothetical protein